MVRHAKNFRLVEALGDEHIGLEARAQMNDHLDTRVWLRLLACSTQIERQIRQLLRIRFATSLPRFDFLAQLDRHPEGLRMSVLSRHLMVTGGNVTGLTDQLVKEGLAQRVEYPEDRRSWRVLLTDKGRADFAQMAAEHEQWLTEMFKELPLASKEALYEHLGLLRVQMARRQADIEAVAERLTREAPEKAARKR